MGTSTVTCGGASEDGGYLGLALDGGVFVLYVLNTFGSSGHVLGVGERGVINTNEYSVYSTPTTYILDAHSCKYLPIFYNNCISNAEPRLLTKKSLDMLMPKKKVSNEFSRQSTNSNNTLQPLLIHKKYEIGVTTSRITALNISKCFGLIIIGDECCNISFCNLDNGDIFRSVHLQEQMDEHTEDEILNIEDIQICRDTSDILVLTAQAIFVLTINGLLLATLTQNAPFSAAFIHTVILYIYIYLYIYIASGKHRR